MRKDFLLTALVLALLVLGGCGGDAETTSAPGSQQGPGVERGQSGSDSARGQEPGRQGGDREAALPAPGAGGEERTIRAWGTEGSDPQRAEAAVAVKAYITAHLARDWETVCSQLAAKLRRGHERLAKGANCAKALERFNSRPSAPPFAEGAEIDVFSLRIGEAHSFLIYGADSETYALAITRENGGWKVLSVAPTALGGE